MKILKQISITTIAVIISMTGIYGGYTLFADDTKYDSFLEESSFYSAQSAYHSGMNDLFNDKISKVTTIVDGGDGFLANKNFNAPGGTDNKSYKEKCGDENVSTLCVALEAMDLYLVYLGYIEGMYGAIEDAPTIEEALRKTTQRNDAIEDEADNARRVMEATVKAYDEFRMAYPVHKKFEETIKNLTKYKLLLKDVRNEASHFPEEFIDTTSKDCE
ncbi:hypothetical protein HN709_01165 [Candidatus Peregrinibacteria bacterium]|jgi:hypothetical protein|nr:hypothetical protein [Candidatus Peregrinibacteria bacterium]